MDLKLFKCYAKIKSLKTETSPGIDALKFLIPETKADLFWNSNCHAQWRWKYFEVGEAEICVTKLP